MSEWFYEWFETVKGEFGGHDDAVEKFLIESAFTTELALSQLELPDLESSGILMGHKKVLLYLTKDFRAKFAGTYIVGTNFLFAQHYFNINYSFPIPIATSFSSSILRSYEQHPPPHPTQVCSALRHTNLLSTHFPLVIRSLVFLCIRVPVPPRVSSNFCCLDMIYRLRRQHSLRF